MSYEKVQAAFYARNCRLVEPENLQELQQVLDDHDINHASWGEGCTKTSEDLLQEINNNECRLLQSDDRAVLGRMLSVATVHIYATVGDQKFKLIEDRQIFSNGCRRDRGLSASLSEKIIADEHPEIAAMRGMTEELSVDYGGVLKPLSKVLSVRESSGSYPGLMSAYRIHPHEANFSRTEYNPDGYQETQGDKTTYFTWQEIEKQV